MNFASLKAKAAEAASNAKSSATAPRDKPTKYTPVRPEDMIGAPRLLTAEERRQQSSVLSRHKETQEHRPIPPPIRSSGAHTHNESAVDAQRPSLPPRSSAQAPPPPPRTNSVTSVASASSSTRPIPAPPYQHAMSHDLPKPSPPPRAVKPAGLSHTPSSPAIPAPTHKRFSEYTTEDKELFFGMLDEFFEQRLRISTDDSGPSAPFSSRVGFATSAGPQRPMPTGFALVSPPTAAAVPTSAPPVSLSTRPATRAPPTPSPLSHPGPSYPPSSAPHDSSAQAIASYVTSSSLEDPWWSTPSPLPPPLQGRSDMRYLGSFSQLGSTKTVLGLVVFGDASVVWWRVVFSAHNPGNPSAREAKYRPIPSSWDAQRLYDASVRYGPRIAGFARQAAHERRVVGRGECWDLAREAIESVRTEDLQRGQQDDNDDEPFPSIGRTHGHLIYYGRANDAHAGNRSGTWYGGDQYVREGDVVEWRSVRIKEVGAAPGSYNTLGDPDHTAVILSAGTPSTLPTVGSSESCPHPITALVSLTVIEQSLGSAPTERTYDLSAMSQGEIWIYRPCGMKELVGIKLRDGVNWDDPGCQTWSTTGQP